jgi:hypothetical protein
MYPKGKWNYVFHVGFRSLGLPFLGISIATHIFRLIDGKPIRPLGIVVSLLVLFVGTLIFGLWAWHRSQKMYQKHLASRA